MTYFKFLKSRFCDVHLEASWSNRDKIYLFPKTTETGQNTWFNNSQDTDIRQWAMMNSEG